MSRFHSYINRALEILSGYEGDKPFAFHIKSFFSVQKKYGSRDRKLIGEICYCWFRVALLFNKELRAEHLKIALFLCNQEPSAMLENIAPELNERVGEPVRQKLDSLGKKPEEVFPFAAALGGNIAVSELAISYLQQPDLFIRVRPGKEKVVREKLAAANIVFSERADSCIGLANGTRLDDIIKINREAVIQDMNSQKVFGVLSKDLLPEGALKVWDCCAASGGKSILFFDKVSKNIKLTVSDIRKSILHNCLERLQQASIPVHQQFVADLGDPKGLPIIPEFDVIICDAPCTGSGTWSRTPEQLAYFEEKNITSFSALQIAIVQNVSPYLKPGGLFFYITCSVFKKENEDVVASLTSDSGLELISSRYLQGFHHKADTMFVSLFRKE